MGFYLGSNRINLTNCTLDNYLKYENSIIQRTIVQYSSNISFIRPYAFADCNALTSINLSKAETIGNYAFAYCSSLTSINLGQTTMVESYAFADCSALTSINLPKAETIKTYAFRGCIALTSINLPKAETIGVFVFASCTALTSINLPKAETIENYAFRRCYHLLSVYLLGSSIPTLSSTAFDSTPISTYTTSTGGVYGSIYVPASLYNSYLTATGWSVYSSRIVSV